MRKWNGIIAVSVLALFAVHAVLGALNMFDIAVIISKPISHTMVALICVHAALSSILTVKTINTARKTKAPYFRENRLFWARRISGYLIMILIFFHLTAFGETVNGVYRLSYFSLFKLITQILLVAAVGIHIITNAKPALITLGIRRLKPRAGDILFFISVILALAAVGFIIYFIRWNTI